MKRFFHPDRAVALALFAIVFATYAATMCRTIYTGDDGDFITASATAGVPHPTGYPLFVLLGRLFLHIVPFGNPAFRMNLMTALFGAAAVAMFFRFAARLVPERFWAAMAALILAFGPTFWQQSLSCEVYSLTCLFLTTLLYLALLWQRQPGNERLLLTLAFLYGLACTNHLTIVLFLPGFLAFVLAARPGLWREGRRLGLLLLAFALPLSLYAYLPLAARGNPPVNWGDPSTLQTFWAHVTGEQFRHLLSFKPRLLGQDSLRYGEHLFREFGFWFLWLAPIGVWSLWRDNRALCLLLAWIWLANVAYAVNYHIFDIYVYYLPSYIVAAAFVAAGASSVNRWVYDRLGLDEERRAHYAGLVAVVVLALPLLQHALHFGRIDKSDNYLEHDFSANLLRSAPADALLVTNGQWTLTLWYRRFVLEQRRDVVLADRGFLAGLTFGNAWYYRHVARMYPDIARTYAPSVADYARTSPQDFLRDIDKEDFLLEMMERAVRRGVPVIVAFQELPIELQTREDRSFFARLNARFDKVPWGVADRLFPKGQAPSPEIVVRVNERLWARFATRGLFTGRATVDPMQAFLPYRYSIALFRLGEHAEKAGRYEVAAEAYRRSDALYDRPEARAGRERSAAALARSRGSLPGRE